MRGGPYVEETDFSAGARAAGGGNSRYFYEHGAAASLLPLRELNRSQSFPMYLVGRLADKVFLYSGGFPWSDRRSETWA